MKTKQQFQVSSVIDSLQSYNNEVIVNDGYEDVIGTANPYQFNLYSDIITNPSSVSISEFQKMSYTQPIIAAGLTQINNLVKNKVGKYQHKNAKYKDFIHKNISLMSRSLDQILTDMLTALWAGFFVGEKRYISDGRYVYVADIEPRPAQSILYRVDSQGHLKDDGIIQYYFNNMWVGYGNQLAFNQVGVYGENIPNPYASRGDFDYPWRTVWAQPIGCVVIPKDKCVHFAYKGLDGLTSPYGRSLLRPGYDYYVANTEVTRILRNAANNGSSSIPFIMVDPDQTITEQGQQMYQDLYRALSTLGNNGGGNNFLLVQGTKDSVEIGKLDIDGQLVDLVQVKEYLDKMLLTSILFPGELAGLSDKGSYALGETQQDLLGRNITAITDSLKECLIEQLIKPLLQLNFNEQEDFGSFEVAETVAEDVALNLDKLNALRNEGIKLKPSAIMSMLDIPGEAIESTNNPILDTNMQGQQNSNFTRTTRMDKAS